MMDRDMLWIFCYSNAAVNIIYVLFLVDASCLFFGLLNSCSHFIVKLVKFYKCKRKENHQNLIMLYVGTGLVPLTIDDLGEHE